jgi:hypothetical protein
VGGITPDLKIYGRVEAMRTRSEIDDRLRREAMRGGRKTVPLSAREAVLEDRRI